MIMILSHRGRGRHKYQENTLDAIRHEFVYDASCDGVEIDLRLTSDHVPVVFHDATTKRIFPQISPPLTISKTQLVDLPFVIPTLQDVLDVRRDTTKWIDIELKDDDGDGGDDGDGVLALYRVVSDIVRGHPRVFMTSFSLKLMPFADVVRISDTYESPQNTISHVSTFDPSSSIGMYTVCEQGKPMTSEEIERLRGVPNDRLIFIITDDAKKVSRIR
jgi:hypothetical protein